MSDALKVLFPVDGSHCSEMTIEWLCQTFNRAGTEVYVLTVVPSTPRCRPEPYEVDAGETLAQKVKTQLEAAGFQVPLAESREGDTVETICAEAAVKDVDMVIMGSHGRTGIQKVLLGSVSSEVLRVCPKPVVVHQNVVRHPLVTMNRNTFL